VVSANVLVVDDDFDVAQTTTAILRGAGMRVYAALSLEYALSLCARQHFDAVVLDHYLDEATGHDFLREAPGYGPVVVVSAAMPDDLAELRHHPKVFAVRTKPCDPSDLIEVIEAAIAEGRQKPAPA
jgi:DNA-binding NtrC family response regulator